MLALTLAITSLAESSWAAFLFFITFDSAWCFTYPLRRNGFVRSRGEGRRGEARRGSARRRRRRRPPCRGRGEGVGRSPPAWHALKKLAREAPPVQTIARMWLRSIRDLAPLGGVLFEPCPAVRHGCHLSSFVVLLLARSLGRSRAVRVPPLPFRVCFAPVSETAIDRGRMKNLVGCLWGRWVRVRMKDQKRENRIGSASQA